MFVFKSTYQSEIKRLEDKLKLSQMLLEMTERRYQAQIDDLHKMVFPQVLQTPDPASLEADSVINGSEKPLELSEKEHNERLDESREMDLIFSGNYSEDLLP